MKRRPPFVRLREAMKANGLGVSAQAVLFHLATYADPKGRAHPSIRTLVDGTGLHRATVLRGLQQAREAGLITTLKRPGASVYTVVPMALGSRTSATSDVAPARQRSRTSATSDVAPARPGCRTSATFELEPISIRTYVEETNEEKKRSGTSPSSEPTKTPAVKRRSAPPEDPDFARFWAAYPRKVGKGAARKAWAKMRPPIDLVLRTVRAFSDTEQWRRENGRFTPHPATWLNQERWNDTPPAVDPLAEYVGEQNARLLEKLDTWAES